MLLFPGRELLAPWHGRGNQLVHLVAGFDELLDELVEHIFQFPDYRQIDSDIFLDRCRVDIDVDDFGVRGKGGYLSGHPVVKTRSDSDQKIGFGNGHIGVVGAVHPQHPQRKRVSLGKRSHPHQGGRDRSLDGFGKAHQFRGGIRKGRSAPHINDRLAGFKNHLDSFFDLPGITAIGRFVAPQLNLVRVDEFGCSHLHVLGQIDQYRAGPPGTSDVKRLLHDARQLPDILHQEIVLGNRPGDTNNVGFLEGIVTNQGGRNLSGDNHQGNGIHVGGGDTGDRIGRSRTAGGDGHPHLPGCPGIPVGGMYRSLLVPSQDVLDR